MRRAKINYQDRNILPYFSQGWTSKLATVLSWLIAGILVLMPFHALLTTWAGSNFGHLDLWRIWKEILFLAMVPPAFWLIWHTPELKKWLISSWIARLFVIYILLHLALGAWSLANHLVNKTALIYALIINLRFIGFFILCAVVASKSDLLRRNWKKLLLAPAAAVIAFGLAQKLLLPYDFLRHFGYGKNTIPAYQTVDSNLDYRRLQSTLRGANPLGAYLALIIPALFLRMFLRVRPLEYSWIRLAGLLGALVVLFLTYSRSAEIGVAIALGLLVWWGIDRSGIEFESSNSSAKGGVPGDQSRRTLAKLNGKAGSTRIDKKIAGRKIMFVLLSVAVLMAGTVYVFRNSQPVQDTLFHTSNNSTAPRSSNADRLQSMGNGVRDVIYQPLGRGPGTAGPASFRNNYPSRIAEDYFLQIGQEIGVLGIALFVAINILVAKQLWQKREDTLPRILLVSLVGITIVNLISHAWTDDTLAYIWWGLAGILLTPFSKSSIK